MPNLSWQEIGNLRHICLEASEKCRNLGQNRQAEYFKGLVEMINETTEKHDSENDDKVEVIKMPEQTESQFLGVSVRGWITLIIVATVCIISSLGLAIKEPLYSAFAMAIGFYFGQKIK